MTEDARHRKNQITHTRNRAWQRLGLHLSKKDCLRISRQIRHKDNAVCRGKISFQLSVWQVSLSPEKSVIILFDGKTQAPVTVLTEQMYQEKYQMLVAGTEENPLKAALAQNPAIAEALGKIRIPEE